MFVCSNCQPLLSEHAKSRAVSIIYPCVFNSQQVVETGVSDVAASQEQPAVTAEQAALWGPAGFKFVQPTATSSTTVTAVAAATICCVTDFADMELD